MALSKSLPKAQIPVGCQLCESGTKIQWTCTDCELIFCDACKTIHLKIPATKDHKVVNIKDIGGNKSSEVSKFQIGFKVVKQYTVDTKNIHYMVVSADGSLWIGDNASEKLLHIKLSSDNVTTLSTFNIEPYGLAISPLGSLLIVGHKAPTLQIINEMTGQVINSKFTKHPWTLTSVYTSKDNTIVVGGHKDGKGVVVVMDSNGKELSKYEKDKDQQLFTYPRRVATTRNGNIFILDGSPSSNKGRVVRIRPGDRDIMFYEGHSDINSDEKPFKPVSILVTPRDNVLFLDYNTDCLYILNNEGDFTTYYNLTDIGVIRPYSMALSKSGNIYVGGGNAGNAPKDSKTTLYELEYSGV